ncbi:Fatty acid amide hydrolase [Acorus gramineus]|uniref:Fatty acid amide hydrolase n=1 Tax=Acorus gramineus TaxID=55184 RepID=A0AAV9AWN0_ACOGR|nr:Fatty acid amide hydrolase [Acorus gramineus]
MVKKRVMLPVKEVDISAVKYEREVVKAPHLTGFTLKLFVWMVEIPLIGSLIMSFVKRKNKIPELLRHTVIPETPMFRPELPPQEVEPVVMIMDEDSEPRARLETALGCLPPHDPCHRLNNTSRNSFLYWTIRDFAHAYRSKLTTPSIVAEDIVSAIGDSNNQIPPMPLLITFDPEELRKQAAASTRRFEEGNPLSILDGIFVAIKDDIDCYPYPTKERQETPTQLTGILGGPHLVQRHLLLLDYVQLHLGRMVESAPCLPYLSSSESLGALRSLRLGKYTEWFTDVYSTDISNKCADVLNQLHDAYGCKTVEIVLPELQEMRIAHLVSIGSESACGLNPEYEDGRRIMYYYMEVFKKVDVIVTPTTGMTAPLIPASSLKFGESNYEVSGYLMRFIIAANLLGLPAISVPVGHDKQGLPIGLQLIGRPWGEANILRLASAVEVGLIVGKLSPSLDRGFIYDLIPTPPTESGRLACSLTEIFREDRKKGPPSKGGKPSQAEIASLSIDGDWVAEHARQVSRMLLGGVNVVGVLPIFSEAFNASSWGDVLRNGVHAHAKELKHARALIDGDLVTEDQQCTSEGSHNVELYLPFLMHSPSEACSGGKEVVGVVVFSGSIYSSTYASPKEPVLQALSDLKGDIIATLESRLDIICDEAERDAGSGSDSVGEAGDILDEKSMHQVRLCEMRKSCSLCFPRRVLVPWLTGVFVCDYLQPSETLEDLKDRCKEIMSLEFPADATSIVEVETQSTCTIERAFWDAVTGTAATMVDSPTKDDMKPLIKGGKSRQSGEFNFNMIAVAILILSIMIGCGILFFGPLKL